MDVKCDKCKKIVAGRKVVLSEDREEVLIFCGFDCLLAWVKANIL